MNRKNPTNRRTALVTVRFTPEERALVERAAAQADRHISAFIRLSVVKSLDGKKEVKGQ